MLSRFISPLIQHTFVKGGDFSEVRSAGRQDIWVEYQLPGRGT